MGQVYAEQRGVSGRIQVIIGHSRQRYNEIQEHHKVLKITNYQSRGAENRIWWKNVQSNYER